ncbi:hypothetical protein N184_32780 [Sinorhizobium sp. GL28]|nr:hypothetical protein N184_32780 [Sinorhizobium sp. GL28]
MLILSFLTITEEQQYLLTRFILTLLLYVTIMAKNYSHKTLHYMTLFYLQKM